VKSIPSLGIRPVTAVTSLDDDVFVMRKDSKAVEVYQYEAGTFKFEFKRHVKVPELRKCSEGIAACGHHKCLYISEAGEDSVHRADLSGSNEVTKWSVAPEPKHLSLAREPKGLSVNDVHNVVVACYKARKIQEHTTHGILVKEICLKAVMTRPWHSVQLSTGYYAVSQNTSPGAVVVVNGDGQELLRYNGDKGVLGYPTSLAVRKIITRESKIDVIHVADSANDRILSMKIKKNSPSYDHHHEGNFCRMPGLTFNC